MTARNRSGAAHEGTRSHGGAAHGAAGGPAGPGREPRPAEPIADAPAMPDASVAAAPEAPETPAAPEAWPGPAGDEAAGLAEAEVTAAEPESSDLPLWDWSGSREAASSDELEARSAEARSAEARSAEARSAEARSAEAPGADPPGADPPRPEWKPVVTPVEEAGGTSRLAAIGQGRGSLSHLSGHPRMRIWLLRALVAVVVLVAFGLWVSWPLGFTLAVIVVIADTVYRARRGSAGMARMTGAQRRTRRQLAKLGRAGYRALHASPIPGSEDQIDHLVVGPAGVFAIDSEAWNKRLPVRTRNARQLWHGPFSMKDRLEHAQWEAQRAGDLLSSATGKPVSVRPAMAVYGPKIPWDVATIREVDVFSGPRLRKYLRRRARQQDVRLLGGDEVDRIYQAANQAFPHLTSGSPAR